MSNLGQRFITGITGALIVFGAILFGEITFLLLLLLMAILGLLEFYHLCRQDGIYPQQALGILATVLLFLPSLLNSMAGIAWNPIPLLIILPYLVFVRELYTKSEKPFTNIGITLLSIIYLAVSLFLFYMIAFHGENKDHYNSENIIGYFLILWANDIGAYFAGRWFGKHKLFERISPKKTWEGSVGGAIFGMILAGFNAHFLTNFKTGDWFVIAAIIIITGSLGDLVESLFKRSIHIKDSGSLLPGHGGVLDRFDALFISAPFVFFYLLLTQS